MLQRFIDKEELAGINCLIWKDGQTLFQASYGYKNLDTQEELTPDALFRISSMTKPITSVVAMILLEENKLKLDDPISKWFPQFEEMRVLQPKGNGYEKAKRLITVLDLLTHRAGFTYSEFLQGEQREAYRKLGGDIDTELSLEQWIHQLANLPLLSHPGEVFNYGRSTDLLGVLISTIEGKPLGKVMEEKIFSPLKMADTFFDVPMSKKGRRVANHGYNELGELICLQTVPLQMALAERPANLEFQSGGQGLWSTVSDYLKFAQLFVGDGRSNGVQILSKDAVDQMCSNQLTASQRQNSSLMGNPLFQEDFGFGLGLATVASENNFGSIPCAGSVGSVGWPGTYGGWWSADRKENKISIFLTHSMTELEQMEQGIGFQLYEAIELFANYVKELK